MTMAVYSVSLVIGILLFCPVSETATQFNTRPSQLSVAVEGQHITLMWTYTLDGTLDRATFVNITGGASELVGRATAPGNLTIASKYQPRFRGLVSNTKAEISIHTVQRADQAMYEFTLLPTMGGPIADDMELIVQFAAEITYINESDVTVDEHSSLLLLCEASGVPTPNITWTRLYENGSETEVRKGSRWPIANISRDFTGTYRCTANNGIGSPDNQITKITVSYLPKIVQLPTEYRSPAEQSVSLQCTADGYPPPSYSWTPCENDNVCDQSVLTISEVKTDQVYTCTATNRLGSDSANTTLVIADDVINVTFVIKNEDCPYTGNQTSLEKELDIEMSNLFNASIYRHTTINALSCGSLIVDLALSFSSVVKENDVLNVLKDAAEDGMLGRFEVDASSVKGTRRLDGSTTPPTGGTTPPASDNMIWIIVGAVLGSLALVAIAVVIIWCVRKKNACRKETKEVSDDNPASPGRGGPSTGQQGRNSGYQDSVDTYANTSMLPPTRKPAKNSMGEKQEPQALPMYAQVDKSKRKPRPEGPAKRQPGELQYAAVDHSDDSRSMPRSTANEPKKPPVYGETVYADLV